MAPRPKNPINDIINATSAWLGGNRGTMPSQTRKGIDTIKGVGKVLDSATGGFGQAVVSDAQRMAQSGSNTPSALYKTAAVNLAAAATGAVAAKVAGKVVSKVVTNRAGKATQAITPTNPDRVIFHAGSDPSVKGPFVQGYRPVDKRPGLANVHMGTESQAVSRQEGRIGFDSEADIPLFERSAIDRYEIVNPQAVSSRRKWDNGEMGPSVSRSRPKYVQYFDDKPTPKNKILKYENEIEGYGKSYLVPKSRVESGDVVYRGTKSYVDQFSPGPYTSPELNRLRNIQTQISANQGRIASAGAAAGVVVPKKKARGGGKNKK